MEWGKNRAACASSPLKCNKIFQFASSEREGEPFGGFISITGWRAKPSGFDYGKLCRLEANTLKSPWRGHGRHLCLLFFWF